DGLGGQTDEGVPAETLSAHDRLEQAAIASTFGAAMRKLQVNGQGRVQVGIGFRNQGNAVVALCRQGVEFDLCHSGLCVMFTYRPGQNQKNPAILWFRVALFW